MLWLECICSMVMKNNVSKKKFYIMVFCKEMEVYYFNSNKYIVSCLYLEGMVLNKWLVLIVI